MAIVEMAQPAVPPTKSRRPVPALSAYLSNPGVSCVLAYTGEMQRFLDGNPGLRSRFTRTITFADYEPNELAAIYRGMAEADGFRLNAAAGCALDDACTALAEHSGRNFGNVRAVRTLWERTREAQGAGVSLTVFVPPAEGFCHPRPTSSVPASLPPTYGASATGTPLAPSAPRAPPKIAPGRSLDGMTVTPTPTDGFGTVPSTGRR
jgi:hypothetical protein